MRLALLLALGGLVACGDKDDDTAGSSEEESGEESSGEESAGEEEGGEDLTDLAPDFTLIDEDEEMVSLSDTDGEVRVILGTAAW